MIRSMTGFGAGRGESHGEVLGVELRSVNAKFCDVKPRMPRELAALEPELIKEIRARLSRGSVDAFVRREGQGQRGIVPRVDVQLASAYAKALRELKDALGLSGDATLQDVVAMEGVVTLAESAPDLASASAALHQALERALDALEDMRRREGEALARDLSSRLDALERRLHELRRLSPQQVEAARERLWTRVAELSRGAPVDESRLAQEIAIMADRTDVAEELTRLASHLQQARGLIASDAPAGRKLDFLVQEVNREINTIGSKSQHAGIASVVVEMKAELERVREQVQNVE